MFLPSSVSVTSNKIWLKYLHTFSSIPRIHPWRHAFSRGRRGASGTGTVTSVRGWRSAGPPSRAVRRPSRTRAVGEVRRRLSQEVGRNQTPHPVQLSHVEPVVVHLTVDVDDVTRLEGQLHLQYSADANTRPSLVSLAIIYIKQIYNLPWLALQLHSISGEYGWMSSNLNLGRKNRAFTKGNFYYMMILLFVDLK